MHALWTALFLVVRLLTGSAGEIEWYPIEPYQEILIDDVVIEYTVTLGAPGVPATWDLPVPMVYHSFWINEAKGREEIGAYLLSTPAPLSAYKKMWLRHDPRGRMLVVRDNDGNIEVALIG